jgi:hypothetical protein
MKLKKVRPGVYCIDGRPDITIERWRATNVYWDIFQDGSVSQTFGTHESLRDVKAELENWTLEKLIESFK